MKLTFADLPGWAEDDHAAALAAFLVSSPDTVTGDARTFFETHFEPVIVGDPPAHFTGYFEPEVAASRQRTAEFTTPVHRDFGCTAPRSEIVRQNLGAGHEIAWVRDAVEAFFLQVQGSACLRFVDGQTQRIGFAAKNGHPYRSIGKILVARGVFTADTINAEGIKRWVRANGDDILLENPSYVFFRTLDLPEGSGPLGAMDLPVTANRTIAVDPDHCPLGTPVWIEAPDGNRLMIAQDIGSAIKGAQRADIFYGTGDAAGERASVMNGTGRMVQLRPKG